MRDTRRIWGIAIVCLVAGMAASAGAGPVYWHGFTFGIPDPPGAPAPGALLLAGIGTGLVGYLRRRGL